MECKCNGNCKNYGKPGCKCAIKDKNAMRESLADEQE